jgi:ABC-2 type transport system ATP-binding protein
MSRVGVVPEDPDAPRHLTWPELSRLCGAMYASWDGAAVEAQLDRMKVPPSLAFDRLSRGQKTATLLSLALGHRPELLVLDDPTIGLDAIVKRDIVGELIDTLAGRGVTVVVATHDFGTFERFAEHVVIVGARRMLLNEGADSLKARFRRIRGPHGADFSGFVTRGTSDRPWGREAIVENFTDDAFEGWRARHPDAEASPLSLEEIFVAVAGEEAVS